MTMLAIHGLRGGYGKIEALRNIGVDRAMAEAEA